MFLKLQKLEKRRSKTRKAETACKEISLYLMKGDFHELHQKHRLSVVSHLAHSHGPIRVHLNGRLGHNSSDPCHSSRHFHFTGPLDQLSPGKFNRVTSYDLIIQALTTQWWFGFLGPLSSPTSCKQ